jgi:hypothetical protein
MNKLKKFSEWIGEIIYFGFMMSVGMVQAIFSREDCTIVDRTTIKNIKEYDYLVNQFGESSYQACEFLKTHQKDRELVRYALEKKKS